MVKKSPKIKKPKPKPIPEYPIRVKKLINRGHDAACACCYTLENLTFDHIIPLSRNGPDTLDNGQILCEHCNKTKSHYILTLPELREYIDEWDKIINNGI